MNERAKLIAGIINKTSTDDRKKLFKIVAEELRKQTQFYTATLLDEVARRS